MFSPSILAKNVQQSWHDIFLDLVLIFQGVKRFYKPGPANLRVYCKDPFCASLRADLPGRRPRCPRKHPHECHYEIGYVDMTTQGVLVNDTISLGEGRNELIVFGYDTN
jgi:hypothetical protein